MRGLGIAIGLAPGVDSRSMLGDMRAQLHHGAPMMGGRAYRIGEVSRMCGLSVDTVRFYEKQGLLGPVRRKSGIRQYDAEVIRRLAFVRRAVALGFTLTEIRSLLRLRVTSQQTCETVRGRALDKLADIERRIADLERMRDALAELAATCAHTQEARCPFLDALDARSRS